MVYFVGAGTGAADLITVRGLRLVQSADIIIYAGSLVNPELLHNAKQECEIYNSAKMTLEEKIGQICQVGPSPVGGFEISEEQAAQLLKDKSISQATYDAIINHLSRR